MLLKRQGVVVLLVAMVLVLVSRSALVNAQHEEDEPVELWALLLTPSLDASCRIKQYNEVYQFIEKDLANYDRMKVVETTSNVERKPEFLVFRTEAQLDGYTISGIETTHEELVELIKQAQKEEDERVAREQPLVKEDVVTRMKPYLSRMAFGDAMWERYGLKQGLEMLGFRPRPSTEAAAHVEL